MMTKTLILLILCISNFNNNDAIMIEGTWTTLENCLYAKMTGIGDKRVETFVFSRNGEFVFESFILNDSGKKYLIKGIYKMDTVNKLIFLKLTKEDNLINKPDSFPRISFPHETVLKYKLVEKDSTNLFFCPNMLEIRYISFNLNKEPALFSVYNFDTISWNEPIKGIIALLENKGKTAQLTKFE